MTTRAELDARAAELLRFCGTVGVPWAGIGSWLEADQALRAREESTSEPAGSGGVTHEEAIKALDSIDAISTAKDAVLRDYIDQQQAVEERAAREVAEVAEVANLTDWANAGLESALDRKRLANPTIRGVVHELFNAHAALRSQLAESERKLVDMNVRLDAANAICRVRLAALNHAATGRVLLRCHDCDELTFVNHDCLAAKEPAGVEAGKASRDGWVELETPDEQCPDCELTGRHFCAGRRQVVQSAARIQLKEPTLSKMPAGGSPLLDQQPEAPARFRVGQRVKFWMGLATVHENVPGDERTWVRLDRSTALTCPETKLLEPADPAPPKPGGEALTRAELVTCFRWMGRMCRGPLADALVGMADELERTKARSTAPSTGVNQGQKGKS